MALCFDIIKVIEVTMDMPTIDFRFINFEVRQKRIRITSMLIKGLTLLLATAWASVADSLKSLSHRSRTCELKMGTIAIFGGTGQTGRECVYQALKANNKVVVLARNPAKMVVPPGSGGRFADEPLRDKNLLIVQGDVTNQEDVNKVFAVAPEISGVIVALGGKTKDVGPTMLTDGTRNIIRAMREKSKAKRIAVMTSIGAGDSEKQAPLVFKALMFTVMRGIFADKNNQEQLFLSPSGPGRDLE
jgi:hypothetical protein